ncbi:MAG: hypothetical protein HOO06_07235 [Bdellovibrionaceae bacterium]|jgi:hypothetical protein|nr:hypothetical protein [Pseudobdellovibrionaceae bacterium]
MLKNTTHLIIMILGLGLLSCAKDNGPDKADRPMVKKSITEDKTEDQVKKVLTWEFSRPYILSQHKQTKLYTDSNFIQTTLNTKDMIIFPDPDNSLDQVSAKVSSKCLLTGKTFENQYEISKVADMQLSQFLNRAMFFSPNAKPFKSAQCSLEIIFSKEGFKDKRLRYANVKINESTNNIISLLNNDGNHSPTLISLAGIANYKFKTPIYKNSEVELYCENFTLSFKDMLRAKNAFNDFDFSSQLNKKSLKSKVIQNCRIISFNNEKQISGLSNYISMQTSLPKIKVTSKYKTNKIEYTEFKQKPKNKQKFLITETYLSNPSSIDAYLEVSKNTPFDIQVNVVDQGHGYGAGKFSSKRDYIGFNHNYIIGNRHLLKLSAHSKAIIKTYINPLEQKCKNKANHYAETMRFMILANTSDSSLMHQYFDKNLSQHLESKSHLIFPKGRHYIAFQLRNNHPSLVHLGAMDLPFSPSKMMKKVTLKCPNN